MKYTITSINGTKVEIDAEKVQVQPSGVHLFDASQKLIAFISAVHVESVTRVEEEAVWNQGHHLTVECRCGKALDGFDPDNKEWGGFYKCECGVNFLQRQILRGIGTPNLLLDLRAASLVLMPADVAEQVVPHDMPVELVSPEPQVEEAE